MHAPPPAYPLDCPPRAIRRWQWEEAVNLLRRQAPPQQVTSHWQTTGTPSVDARARAHVAEWLALDQQGTALATPTTIIDALVYHALAGAHWDLYVVEGTSDRGLAVRRLHDQQGYQLPWLEGRETLPPGRTIALRIAHLDPPGVDVATLPLLFGVNPGVERLTSALLTAFGADGCADWPTFMRGLGGRILLEYSLSFLGEQATSATRTERATSTTHLDEAFARLESRLRADPTAIARRIVLDDGRVAWLEDLDAGPCLLLFDDEEHRRHYLRRQRGPHRVAKTVPWSRVYRATADQLSMTEQAIALQAGHDPQHRGLLRVERRNRWGHLLDLDSTDRQAFIDACDRFIAQHNRGAA